MSEAKVRCPFCHKGMTVIDIEWNGMKNSLRASSIRCPYCTTNIQLVERTTDQKQVTIIDPADKTYGSWLSVINQPNKEMSRMRYSNQKEFELERRELRDNFLEIFKKFPKTK
jgi:hypothetical protein